MTKNQKAKELGLTGKEQRFAEEYLKDFNATRAADRAGYQASTRGSLGSTAQGVLKKPEVQEYLDFCMMEVQERNDIEIDEVVSLLADIARFDIADLFDEDGNFKPIHEIPKAARMSIEGIESYEDKIKVAGELIPVGTVKKIKTGGRQAAIEKLMRYWGSFQKDNEQKPAAQVHVNEPDTVIFRDFKEGDDEVDTQ